MNQVIHGDCLDALRNLPNCSVDSVVTDPPAGIAFMGKAWDGNKGGRDLWVAWLAERLAECLRVLKPGGHAVVWALPRTSGWTHRALEDAGFEVRDCITHLFGSGFPKSANVSKLLDKAAGCEREVIGDGPFAARRPYADHASQGMTFADDSYVRPAGHQLTAPATDAAQQWDGWGTALKPAAEFWYLARKPLAGTVAQNVTAHGTGALNIDGCRVGTEEASDPRGLQRPERKGVGLVGGWASYENQPGMQGTPNEAGGRWPANTVLTHNADCNGQCSPGCAVAELDRQSGTTVSPLQRVTPRRAGSEFGQRSGWNPHENRDSRPRPSHGDSGGASRFFPTFRYQAKPSTRERSAGLDHLPERDRNREEWRLVENSTAKTGQRAEFPRRNPHPTVKPVELMRWLVRLVTPPGGTVLDCFAGSGTTLVAATLEGFDSIGIEAEAEYLPIIQGRVAWAERQSEQSTLPI